jgi:hypothetical protein
MYSNTSTMDSKDVVRPDVSKGLIKVKKKELLCNEKKPNRQRKVHCPTVVARGENQ